MVWMQGLPLTMVKISKEENSGICDAGVHKKGYHGTAGTRKLALI
jgi:hypothetical protein